MLCRTLFDGFVKEGYLCEAYGMSRYAAEWGLTPLEESVRNWCGRQFAAADAIVFVGACGIAVRGIAPFVRDKREDPAVLVVDERGQFVISLLSGHIGGANALARQVAGLTGAVPVVTTATDVNGLFAVDEFAVRNGMVIENMRYAKQISAALLDREAVGFYSGFPVEGDMPSELVRVEEAQMQSAVGIGIAVTLYDTDTPYPVTLRLYPRIVCAGIGCRKGTPAERVEQKVLEVLRMHHIPPVCICQAASIDLKKEEQGILDFCRKYGIPFVTFSAEELGRVPGDFSASSFVSSVTGVDNVCERAALCAAGTGTLIRKKYAGDGVTVALAVKKWRICFE